MVSKSGRQAKMSPSLVLHRFFWPYWTFQTTPFLLDAVHKENLIVTISRLISTKCARCNQILRPTDFVYRCFTNTYHADCFSCVYCSQALKKGDQYLVLEGQIICRADYETYICGQGLSQGRLYTGTFNMAIKLRLAFQISKRYVRVIWRKRLDRSKLFRIFLLNHRS